MRDIIGELQMLKIVLTLIFIVSISYSSSASPLWTEGEIRAECKATWKDDSVSSTDYCVQTTKERFTGPVDRALEKFDPTQEPLSSIITECRKYTPGGVRGLSGCIQVSIKPIRLFLSERPGKFDWGDGQFRALTGREEEGIKSAVAAQLKDPESAKFSLGQYNGSAVYCGMFNAKNSYGGYAGFQRFIIDVAKTSGGLEAGGRFVLGDEAQEACETFRYR